MFVDAMCCDGAGYWGKSSLMHVAGRKWLMGMANPHFKIVRQNLQRERETAKGGSVMTEER